MKYLHAALISASLITASTYGKQPSCPVEQPAQVTVVNPVTVKGNVDIGNKVEISGNVQTLNDALKIPFNQTVKGSIIGRFFVGDFYKVPVGMRLTIESVSAAIQLPPGQKAYGMLIFEGTTGEVWRDFVSFQSQGVFDGNETFVASQNLKIVVDSSAGDISYSVFRNSDTGGSSFTLTFHGYLEAVP